ncbi:MAG TPA: phospholipase D-like domain-containing protein [Candidatus Nanoarchaeia archaeon]|nr:phospholipase D-like domain-containing protein [Candidatus Nanoarchaeia archaeon]
MTSWKKSGKGRLVFILLLIIALIIFLIFFRRNAIEIEPNQSISVFMCINATCEDKLSEFIENSNAPLDCALYELKSQKVIDAFKSSKASLRIIIDRDEINDKNNFSFVRAAKNHALMHNKFCISDEKVLTGSYNPTNNIGDDNNMLIVKSRKLAQNYETEFLELWEGKRNIRNIVTNFQIGNITVENYFCPEDDCAFHVSKTIQSANKSIYFMTFSFTHPQISTDVVLKYHTGLNVKGVLEKSQKSNFSKYDLFKTQGIDVKWDGNKGTMHHKVFIIDNETVITGSFNPSKNADERNDENLLIIHDKDIASIYLNEFERVWSKT